MNLTAARSSPGGKSLIYGVDDYLFMFGTPNSKSVMKNVFRAIDRMGLKAEPQNENVVILTAMGDDLPIGMMIAADDTNMTLNIYCYLMFDIPEEARSKLLPELNTINNEINNGAFYMDKDEPKIIFKMVQSYLDQTPSVDMIAHLIKIAFGTVDINDGKLKGLIPASALRKVDCMYS